MHTLSRIFKQAKYGRANLALIDDLNASLRALQVADKARQARSLDILRSDAYSSRTEYDPANIKIVETA